MSKDRKVYDIPIETDPNRPARKEHEPEAKDAPGAERPDARQPSDVGEQAAEEVAAAVSEVDELRDRLQRLQAEFANYRRRVDRERADTVVSAQKALVERLLPVLDDFDRAVLSVEGDGSPAAQGLAMIREKLGRVLEEAGLERIEATGHPFDPGRHEAILTQVVDAERAGQVIGEIEPGYFFKGKLARPSRVQVGVEGEDGENDR